MPSLTQNTPSRLIIGDILSKNVFLRSAMLVCLCSSHSLWTRNGSILLPGFSLASLNWNYSERPSACWELLVDGFESATIICLLWASFQTSVFTKVWNNKIFKFSFLSDCWDVYVIKGLTLNNHSISNRTLLSFTFFQTSRIYSEAEVSTYESAEQTVIWPVRRRHTLCLSIWRWMY